MPPIRTSKVLHRTPLTARAFPDILSRRPIVRIDFYGTSSNGGASMAFRQPAEGATPWRPLEHVAIPPSLSKVLGAHAADVGNLASSNIADSSSNIGDGDGGEDDGASAAGSDVGTAGSEAVAAAAALGVWGCRYSQRTWCSRLSNRISKTLPSSSIR